MIRLEETKNEFKKKKKKQRQHGFGSVRYGFTGWDVQKHVFLFLFPTWALDRLCCAPTSSPCFLYKATVRAGCSLDFTLWRSAEKKKKGYG